MPSQASPLVHDSAVVARDYRSEPRFLARRSVVGYLASWGDFGWFVDVASRLSGVAMPFTALYRHELFVATRA